MVKKEVDLKKIDAIIKNTIDVVSVNKIEIYEIAQCARKQCKRLEKEYSEMNARLETHKDEIIKLEKEVVKSKKRLLQVSADFNHFSSTDIQSAYERADESIVKLSVYNQELKYMQIRRSELEASIKEAYKTVRRAESSIENVSLSLAYLSGNLFGITEEIEGLTQKYHLGLKVIRAQEDERKRVAKDIFEGPVRILSAAQDKILEIEEEFTKNPDSAKESMGEVKGEIRNALYETRQVIYNLRPMSLDDLGLVPTLQRYIENFMDETQMDVFFDFHLLQNEMTPILNITLFRIIQEGLLNVKKHAKAKHVRINVETTLSGVNLHISDDGIGFNTAKFDEQQQDVHGGFGLYAIKERLTLLDGNMDIITKVGDGTKMLIFIPHSAEQAREK